MKTGLSGTYSLLRWLSLVLSIGFTACGSNLFEGQSEPKIYPNYAEIKPGESTQIQATGGVKPYRFTILNDTDRPGDSVNDSGVYTASSQTGFALVRFNDALGAYLDTIIKVTPFPGKKPHAIILYAIGLTADSVKIQLNGSQEISLTPANPVNWFSTPLYETEPYTLAVTALPTAPAGMQCVLQGTLAGAMPDMDLIYSVLCQTGFQVGGVVYAKDPRIKPPVDFSATNFSVFAGFPGANAYADNAIPTTARFNLPAGITLIKTTIANAAFVADSGNKRIRMMDMTTKAVSTFAGSGVSTSMDGDGVAASFSDPGGITTEGFLLYVSDTGGHSIKKIELWAPYKVLTLAGPKDCGVACASGDVDGTGTVARLSSPGRLVYSRNYVYFSDTGNKKVKKLSLLDNSVKTVATFPNAPSGVTADDTYLYVAVPDSHRVYRIHLDTEVLEGVLGDGVAQTRDGKATSARVNTPENLFHEGHYIYVTEKAGTSIRRYLPSTGYLETLYMDKAGGGNTGGDIFTASTGSVGNYLAALASDGQSFYLADTNVHALWQISSGLVAQYPLSVYAADPTKARDRAFPENPADIHGASPVTEATYNARTNAAYRFDGASFYMEGSAALLPSGNNPRTVCAWVSLDDRKGDGKIQTIFSYGTAHAQQNRLYLEYEALNPGSVKLGFEEVGTGGVASSLFIPTNVWMHVCGSYGGGNANIYLNGKISMTNAAAWNTNTSGNFNIGRMETLADSYFKGKIADVRVYNRNLNPKEIARLAVAIPDGLIAHYPMMGTSSDITPSGNDGSQFGGVAVTNNAFGDINNAYSFDGNDGRVVISNSSQITAPPAITASLWVQFKNITVGSSPDYIQTLAAKASGGGAPDAQTEWDLIYDTPNDALKFRVVDGTGIGATISWNFVKEFLHPDDWYHIAVTWDSTAMRMYINGTAVASQTAGVPATMQSGIQLLRLGGSNAFVAGGRPFRGNLDDVKLYNRALSVAEVKALATQRGDNLALRLGDASGYDYSGFSSCGMPDGGSLQATPAKNQNGSTGMSYFFNGSTTSYFNAGCNKKLMSMGNLEGFTVCTFVNPKKLPANPGDFQALLDFRDMGTTQMVLAMRNQAGAQQIGLYGDNPVADIFAEASHTLPLNSWSHICAHYSKNPDTVRIYVNGTEMANQSPMPVNLAYVMYVYPGKKDAGNYFQGRLSDIRIYEKALSQEQIVRLSTAVPAGLVSHLPVLEEPVGGIYNIDYINAVQKFNEMTPPHAVNGDRHQIPNSAYVFNGVNKYLAHSDAPSTHLPIGSEPFTACAWVRSQDSTGIRPILSFGVANPGNAFTIRLNNGILQSVDSLGTVVQSGRIFENVWTHLCVSNDSALEVHTINGTNQISIAFVRNNNQNNLWVGKDNGDTAGFFKGELEEVRIYNRILSLQEIRALSGYHPSQTSVWNATPALSKLRFHIAADSLNQADNSAVTALLDMSGNVHDLSQVVPVAQPKFRTAQWNGMPVLEFTGSQYMGIASSLGMGGYTVTFFHAGKTTGAGISPIFSLDGTVEDIISQYTPASTFQLKMAGISILETTGSFPANEYLLLSGVYNNLVNTNTAWKNAVNVTSSSASFSPIGALNNQFFLGIDIPPSNYYNGHIAETILFNTALSTADRQIVECYLSAKYGMPLSVSCP